jgi:enolase-phosphatase E1
VSGARAPADFDAILLDIEGTTTPIRFVYEVLFPYARAHLDRHLAEQADSPDHAPILDSLQQEHATDAGAPETGVEPVPPLVAEPASAHLASIAAYCRWLMDRDRKSPGLKALQGKIWESGYKTGELVGQVFADVPAAFERWHAQRVPIGIFSSGSALAQQLLFRHSSSGDLSHYLKWFFDTRMGAKSDGDSYRRIAESMERPTGHVLFVSDVVRELDAAFGAGMHTRLAVRPGNQPPGDHSHQVIRSFDELT